MPASSSTPLASQSMRRRPPAIHSISHASERSSSHGLGPRSPFGARTYSSRSARGLGRQSTSSSVSSIHQKSRSRASSTSSAASFTSSNRRSRTPRGSRGTLKVLPSAAALPGSPMVSTFDENHPNSVVFARRKKTPFRGPSSRSPALLSPTNMFHAVDPRGRRQFVADTINPSSDGSPSRPASETSNPVNLMQQEPIVEED